MTCIVGLERDGKVYIGGDSASVTGLHITTRRDRKVFTRDGMAFGFTSSWRMGQLIRYQVAFPDLPISPPDLSLSQSKRAAFEAELDGWMVTEFVEAIREGLKDGGYSKVESNQEEGGTFLVGARGCLYAIFSDFQVARVAHEFDAVGCGEQYARGAMEVMHNGPAPDEGPADQVVRALRVAAKYSAGVRGPYHVVSV